MPTGVYPRKPLAERFWAKVRKTDSCWLWVGAKYKTGYGSIGVAGGRAAKAHRVVWELCVGPIADGLHVLHRCDVPLCVNPAHLFLGTHQDNMADMVHKGRAATGERNASRLRPHRVARGERNGHAKLKPADVRVIRSLASNGVRQQDIATKFGISQSLVSVVAAGKRWRHL